MSFRGKHRDIALKLLRGRTEAAGGGALPWTPEEDWSLVEQERALWTLLTDQERAAEQEWLANLWETPEGSEGRQGLSNEAFGLPRANYRPSSRGRPVSTSGDGGTVEWLWGLGFQAVAEPEVGVLLLQTPKNRVVPEVDRLMALLRKADRADGVELLACYDPGAGKAWIEVKGLA